MSDVEFLRGKLERLNAEKRCWQLVKEILTFLVKVKREGERLAPVGNSPSRNILGKNESGAKKSRVTRLVRLSATSCPRCGRTRNSRSWSPATDDFSLRNTELSPCSGHSSRGEKTKAAGEKSELNRFLSSPHGRANPPKQGES